MAVFLVILKWIFIILGILLGIAVLAVAAVTCVPVRYQLMLEAQGEFCYGFVFSWLCHLLTVRKKLESDDMVVRLFGIPVFRQKVTGAAGKDHKGGAKEPAGKPAGSAGKDCAGEKKEPAGEPTGSTGKDRAGGKKEPVGKPTGSAGKDHKGGAKELAGKSAGSTGKDRAGEKKENRAHRPKRKKAGDSASDRDVEQKGKKRFSFDKLSSIMDFVRDSGNRSAFRKIAGEVFGLLRYLKPHWIKGYLHVGTGDPCTTGLLLGGISLFPVFYQEEFRILPDFEEKVLEGSLRARGRVRVLYLLRMLLRLYGDNEVKGLFKSNSGKKKEAA